MNSLKTGFIAAIVCFVASVIHAQQIPVEKLSFQNITINDGLSQGMVNQILQDRYGFMWFATKDGLNQYDGYHFKIHRHDTEDSSSLSESFVQALFEDSEGRLWAGTSSGNLDFFDHASGKFQHIISEKNKNLDQSIGPIYQIAEDKQGKIWLLYFAKLFVIKINGKDKKGILNYSIEQVPLPSSDIHPKLLISGSGEIYFYHLNNPVFYTFQSQSRQWLANTLGNDESVAGKYPGSYNIINMTQDLTTNTLYAICPKGIFAIDYGHTGKQILNYSMQEIVHCFMDKENNIWFSDHQNFGIFNTKTGKLNFITAPDNTNQIRLGLFNSACVDQSGMIWIGTTGYGLLTLNYDAHKFHHMGQTSVYIIKEMEDGRIMVSSDNGEMKFLDPATGTYVGTMLQKNAKVYFEDFSEISLFFMLDKEKRKWFTDNKRLISYDEITKDKKVYQLPVKQTGGNYSLVSDIKKDMKGKIWLGTMDGLLCFDEKNVSWQIIKNDPKDKSSLSYNSIFSLCFDPVEPAKYLWIGTNGGGLNRMDISTGKCVRYSVKNGLPNDVIYGILYDNANNLWMSTNKGLSCFNPAKQTFKNYEEKDGLQGNEFNHNAYLRTSKGILFFGGVNGYNYFDPAEIVNNPVAPKVVITDLRIRNKTAGVEQPGSPLENAIYLTKKVTLPYSDNMITFEFAALDFIAPEKNQYQYKLDGFDDDWINSGNTHVATYTNLDPGTYTFSVKGSNKDGVWNEEGTTLQLVIIPPWYMTWWFRILIVLAVSSVIYYFYRYRLNQALKLHTMRNSIANDLHDEIGSNLSNISIFSEVAQQRKGTPDETEPLLQKISEYSQVSMAAMSDIVWMINARNDAFENIISRMRSLAAEVFEAKNYALHLHFDEQLNQLSLNMEQRKNFYLIYKEAINNVAKYSACQNVWITLKKDNSSVILTVKDDGVGFITNNQNQGNGLYNMQKRAEVLKGKLTINSAVGKGTMIQLIFNC
jgi:ligand-binding sensor domain-containing protein/two-component sensor histidine kinase